MTKHFLVWAVILCSVRAACGQCGSAHDSDIDGSFVSSTSSDPCGHVFLQASLKSPLIESPSERHLPGPFLASQEPSQEPEASGNLEVSASILFEKSSTITAESFGPILVFRSWAQGAAASEQLLDVDDRISVTIPPVNPERRSGQAGTVEGGAHGA